MIPVVKAAAIAGVSRAYIPRLLRQGKIKGEFITPSMLLIDEASLREWMDDPKQHRVGNPNFKHKESNAT